MEYPQLRPLEAFPVEHEGKRFICFRDPQGYLEAPLFMPMELFGIIQHFDGSNSLRDVQAAFMRQQGELLHMEQLEAIVREMDQVFLLESDSFRSAVSQAHEAFRRLKVRPSALAGRSYPAEADELTDQLEGFFTAPGGPGPVSDEVETDGRLTAAVAPHIDYARGGVCYAYTYKALRESSRACCFVILGTCHQPINQPFCLTRKAFETPLGVVPTDGAFIDSLQGRVDYDLFEDEFIHRSEHTIELQAVFLQHITAGRRPFRIVPILVGSFHENLSTGTSPMAAEPIGQFIEALRETIDEASEDVCLVGSADLAHVGPRFGDPQPLDEADWERVKRDDLSLMDHVAAADAEGLFREMVDQGDRNRICGFPPIYTLLAVLDDQAQGRLLNYGQWPDAYSTVTYASLVFQRT